MTNPIHAAPPTHWPVLPDPAMIDEILGIIANEAKLDRAVLLPGATMESLGIPSLDMVEILFEVEERFGIYIPMGEELVDTVYLHDLIKVLADQMAAK
jgi:acyl carrier protein